MIMGSGLVIVFKDGLVIVFGCCGIWGCTRVSVCIYTFACVCVDVRIVCVYVYACVLRVCFPYKESRIYCIVSDTLLF